MLQVFNMESLPVMKENTVVTRRLSMWKGIPTLAQLKSFVQTTLSGSMRRDMI